MMTYEDCLMYCAPYKPIYWKSGTSNMGNEYKFYGYLYPNLFLNITAIAFNVISELQVHATCSVHSTDEDYTKCLNNEYSTIRKYERLLIAVIEDHKSHWIMVRDYYKRTGKKR